MISLIAAHDKNRGIGKNNKIPWHIPEDFKHFKKTTMGHPVIMGRKTYESIGRPLPGRENIIVTRDTHYTAPTKVVYSLEEGISYAESVDRNEIFIIGGAELYKQSIDMADKLYITAIDKDFDVDTYFPEYRKDFILIDEKKRSVSDYSYSFQTYTRI